MSATRADCPTIEPASADRQSWFMSDLDCTHCGLRTTVVHQVNFVPQAGECHCGHDEWELADGEQRYRVTIH